MSTKAKEPLPLEVDQLKQQVQEWRQTRKGAEPTPHELWAAAIPLARKFGICRIARAVGLDYSWLRTRVARVGRGVESQVQAPSFVELPSKLIVPEPRREHVSVRPEPPSPVWPMAAGSVIEVSNPTGAQMRICLEAGQVVDAAGIIAAFLRRGH